jgi:nitroreductase
MSSMSLFEAVATRRSMRAFLPEPLSQEVLTRVFAVAQQAPSWCNIQPWRVIVTSPPTTAAVREALVTAARTSMPAPELPFPGAYPEPYLTHRRACGGALYQAMGIGREDKAAREGAWMRNFELFDAPHVAIVSMDRRLGPYAAVDIGCWLQTLLLAVTAEGFAACPQASLATYPQALRGVLPIPAEEAILFGVSLGRVAPDAPANRCTTSRSPLAENVRLLTAQP